MFEMTYTETVGSIGVFLLLIAFFMNLIGAMSPSSLVYVCLNLLGAGLACYASWLLDFFPFVVLEGTWAVVAAFALGRIVVRGAIGESPANGDGGKAG
jgi:hypothetical protein